MPLSVQRSTKWRTRILILMQSKSSMIRPGQEKNDPNPAREQPGGWSGERAGPKPSGREHVVAQSQHPRSQSEAENPHPVGEA